MQDHATKPKPNLQRGCGCWDALPAGVVYDVDTRGPATPIGDWTDNVARSERLGRCGYLCAGERKIRGHEAPINISCDV